MQASKQSGAALAVSLFMLGTLTLIGVAAISSGTVNFRLVNNLQAQKEVEKAAQAAVETYLSDALPFGMAGTTCDPPPQTVTVNGLVVTVDLEEPDCLGSVPTPRPPNLKDTELHGVATRDATWEIRATAWEENSGTTWDKSSGARFAAHWGVVVRLLNACSTVRTNTPCS
jgi:hypothetical protein